MIKLGFLKMGNTGRKGKEAKNKKKGKKGYFMDHPKTENLFSQEKMIIHFLPFCAFLLYLQQLSALYPVEPENGASLRKHILCLLIEEPELPW